MPDQHFARINDDWALASDGIQWILQKRHPRKDRPDTWDGVWFVRSTREVLARGMRIKDVPAGDAERVLATLPATFDEWHGGTRPLEAGTSDFRAAPLSDTGSAENAPLPATEG
jgi:hypothetical protein